MSPTTYTEGKAVVHAAEPADRDQLAIVQLPARDAATATTIQAPSVLTTGDVAPVTAASAAPKKRR